MPKLEVKDEVRAEAARDVVDQVYKQVHGDRDVGRSQAGEGVDDRSVDKTKFMSLLEKNFAKLDPDNNGISRKELDAALKNPKGFTKDEQAMLKLLSKYFDTVINISDDEPGKETTISQTDKKVLSEFLNHSPMTLADLRKWQKEYKSYEELAKPVTSPFPAEAAALGTSDKSTTNKPTDRPAATGEKPAATTDKPAGTSDKPAATTDKPAGTGDQSGEDKPHFRKEDVPIMDFDKFTGRAQQLFEKLDTDHDGFLGAAELRDALQDKGYTGQDAQVVAALYLKRTELAGLSNDEFGREASISANDLKEFGKLADRVLQKDRKGVPQEEVNFVFDVCGPLIKVGLSQKKGNFTGLYSDAENPLNSIKPDAVQQSALLGDCYYEAAVASVASSNPQVIRDMIKDNGNGTYTVTFPGAPKEPITVKAPTEAELGLYNGVSPRGTWASVLEKAYGEYAHKHSWLPDKLVGAVAPQEYADGGGVTARAVELLTGNSTDGYYLPLTKEATTTARLTEAFNTKPPLVVTAGSERSLAVLFGGNAGFTSDGFTRSHAYSITGFDPQGPDGGTITVRNPYGRKDGTAEGTINISLKNFFKNFSDIVYEVRKQQT